ncbi:uncharacterized protein LOC105285476 isoform X1 [Ooceraea biroi]|nr:uncharacterized protein LOC105285476 isoform X1 [Ooceraea biroi]
MKYGPRRRFGRTLVKWMSLHNCLIDPELLAAYGDMQPAYTVDTDNKESVSAKSSNEVASLQLIHFPKRDSSNSLSTNISSCSSNFSESPLLLSQDFNEFVSSEQIETKNKELADISDLQIVNIEDTVSFDVNVGINVEDTVSFYVNVGTNEPDLEDLTETSVQLEDELKDFDDVTTAPVQTSSDKEQERQSPIPNFNTANAEGRTPLLNLLHKNGSHLQKLIHNIHRKDLVPVGSDINLIGKVTAKHLLNLATPPLRKIPTSTLIRWSKYFKRLFPKTPTSAFYAFKYEPYRRSDGIILQRKRAQGVLQVQLFQERRKLLKENRDVLLRQPSTSVSTGRDRSPCPSNISHITKTWRSVSQSEGEIQSRTEIPREVSLSQTDPTIESHLNYLRNELHYKLTSELLSSWEATFTYRRNQLLHQSGTVWDYLNEYRVLQIEEVGKVLIEQDFEKLCPNLDPVTRYSGNLAKNCEKYRLAIIATASVLKIKYNKIK